MRILGLLAILIPTTLFGATISLDSVDVKPNKQLVFFTVTHNSIDYPYHVAISISVDPATHIQSQVDTYMSQIYREMYRKAPHNLNSIITWEIWITSGAFDSKGRVVNRKPFKGKHPKRLKLKADTVEANSVPELRAIILEMLEN